MKTSARNYFEGSIIQIKAGEVNDEIILDVGSDIIITSIITKESTKKLELKPQAKAFALIKSSSVILATDMDGILLSTRNCLSGIIKKIVKGAVNSEIGIELVSGQIITAIVTNESAHLMDLRIGAQASAIFKASHVILGIKK